VSTNVLTTSRPPSPTPAGRRKPLAALACGLTAAGERQRAVEAANLAEAVSVTIADPDAKQEALVMVIRAMAAAGKDERAVAIAGMITNPMNRAFSLVMVVRTLAAAGERQRAVGVAELAQTFAARLTGYITQSIVLTDLVEALASAGECDRAITLAATIPLGVMACTQVELVEALVIAREYERAEVLARAITAPDDQARALAGLAAAVFVEGDLRDYTAFDRRSMDGGFVVNTD